MSALNICDLVGNVWKWLDELLHDPTATTGTWYDPMEGQGYGQIWTYSATALHALIGGGGWTSGVHCGSRAVGCDSFPWNVSAGIGVWCVCDSL